MTEAQDIVGETTEETAHLTVADAAKAARHGDYTTARMILDDLGGTESADPVALDLLARVYAQQGNLVDAELCWWRSVQHGGDPALADAGRRRIAELRSGVRTKPNVRRAVVVGALAGVVVVGAGFLGAALTRTGPNAPTDPAAQSTIISLSQQVDQLRKAPDSVAAQRGQLLDRLASALAGSAMTITRGPNQVNITFKVAIFDQAVAVSADGALALADLGNRLRQFGNGVTVTIIGHTEALRVNPASGYADNDALGLARALTAANQLATDTGQPLSSFDLATSGTADPPYSNATPQGSALNHTVTVTVTPH